MGPQDSVKNSNSFEQRDRIDNSGSKKYFYKKRRSEAYFGIIKETETMFGKDQKFNLVNVKCNNKFEDNHEHTENCSRNKVLVSVEIEITNADSTDKDRNKLVVSPIEKNSKHNSEEKGMLLQNWPKETLL